MALTQKELNQSECSMNHHGNPCKHDVLYFAARCHPSRGVTAEYIKSLGILQFRCRKCFALVCDVAVDSWLMKANTGELNGNIPIN